MPDPKHLSQDERIRSIVQKHMSALSREIAEELTQPLLEHWGLLSPDTEAEAEPAALYAYPTTLIYDGVTRHWTCPRCRYFSNLRRRSVTAHLRSCTAPKVDLRAWTTQLRAEHRKRPTRRRARTRKKKS